MTAFAYHTLLEGAGVLAATFLLYRCWLREKRERAYHRRYLERMARRAEDLAWQLWLAGVREWWYDDRLASYVFVTRTPLSIFTSPDGITWMGT